MTTPIINPSKAAVAFVPDNTLVVALELSGKSWLLGAIVPGLAKRPLLKVMPGSVSSVVSVIGKWKAEAAKAGATITRVVLTYEAGRDGFWIARHLIGQGIETHVVQASSIPVERKGQRRAKTDRIDIDMLLRTLLAWLRGEPRVCSMVRVPTVEEEDARRPGREREVLVRDRVLVENRINSLLILHGIVGFKARLKKAMDRLEALRTPTRSALPANTMKELRRLMARHRVISEQIKEIETQRDQVIAKQDPNKEEQTIQRLVSIVGLGTETATLLVKEMLWRSLRDRKALAKYAGLTGTPFASGGTRREQGIGRDGNPRVRGCLLQLAWRWLMFQPESRLSKWFLDRTAGAKGRIRKVMIVAMTRKLLVQLWRFVETGEVPDGARLRPA